LLEALNEMKETIKSDIIIIGAGLSGLTLAYLLRNKGLQINILEARDRIGGRIFTRQKENAAPIEMGATWLGLKHRKLTALLNELDIDIVEQYTGRQAIYEPDAASPPQLIKLPHNPDPSYRIQGSSSKLIHTLASKLSPGQILLQQDVQRLSIHDEYAIVETTDKQYQAKTVVSTLPPFLLLSRVKIEPSLPRPLTDVMQYTHTWMGESIKIGLRFPKPFWKNAHTSGTIFSNAGPITEFYDHTDHHQQYFALKGFLHNRYHALSRAERLTLVLNQLRKYYGSQVDHHIGYEEAVWSKEHYTYTPYKGYIAPHQNNGHPIYQKAYFDNKLYIAGSETAPQFPGYMDGAVSSAHFVSQQIEQRLFPNAASSTASLQE
jgi:monoamine oxidase